MPDALNKKSATLKTAPKNTFTNRDLILVVLFILGAFLIVTSLFNWISVSAHNKEIKTISQTLSTPSQIKSADERKNLTEKLKFHQEQFDASLMFPRVFFIIVIVLELMLIIQILREFFLIPKESSSDDHEAFKMKSIFIIIPVSFINILYMLLRLYLFETFFPRFLLYLVSFALLAFSAIVLFSPTFVNIFIPKKAPTLDEFEKLAEEFNTLGMSAPPQNQKKENKN